MWAAFSTLASFEEHGVGCLSLRAEESEQRGLSPLGSAVVSLWPYIRKSFQLPASDVLSPT